MGDRVCGACGRTVRDGDSHFCGCRFDTIEVQRTFSAALAGSMEFPPRAPLTAQEAARALAGKMANPFDHADMNDGSINWQSVYDAMREAHKEEDGHMGSVLMAAMIALSGFDPYDSAGLGDAG